MLRVLKGSLWKALKMPFRTTNVGAVYCEVHVGDKDEETADSRDELRSWFEDRGFTVERGHEANSSYHLIARSDKS